VSALPRAASVLAVCAHPDDESFGLGAILDLFARGGARVSVLCLTHGEASTLGRGAGSLGEVRSAELERAGAELGVSRVDLLDYPDGGLSGVDAATLALEVSRAAARAEPDLVVTFDEGGITGHPDHQRATAAALSGAPGSAVLAWCLPARVAAALNGEFESEFVGRDPSEVDLVVPVDRSAQRRAIAQHASQSTDNAVLSRRLEIQGGDECLRWLRAPLAA
jgi:N-acetylglucosamine malate deacetylase 2